MHTDEEEEVPNDEQTENEINGEESFDIILHRVNDMFEENKEEYKSEECSKNDEEMSNQNLQDVKKFCWKCPKKMVKVSRA